MAQKLHRHREASSIRCLARVTYLTLINEEKTKQLTLLYLGAALLLLVA